MEGGKGKGGTHQPEAGCDGAADAKGNFNPCSVAVHPEYAEAECGWGDENHVISQGSDEIEQQVNV